MRLPPSRLLSAAAVLAAVGLTTLVAAGSASAAPGDSTVTFTLGTGALTISEPASVALGAGSPGTNLTGQMGAVTVTDARAQLAPTWTATVASSTFVTGSGGAAETVAKADVAYASGLATASTGLSIVLVPGQPVVGVPSALGTSVTAFRLTAGVGNNSATWNPTLVISIPAAAVAGTYTGTITHSVA